MLRAVGARWKQGVALQERALVYYLMIIAIREGRYLDPPASATGTRRQHL